MVPWSVEQFFYTGQQGKMYLYLEQVCSWNCALKKVNDGFKRKLGILLPTLFDP